MSIIGTRPPLISETNFYELHHRARLAIKPGITGMWQVSGRSDIAFFKKLKEILKEKVKDIYIVPGNHDKVRNSIDAKIIQEYKFEGDSEVMSAVRLKYS